MNVFHGLANTNEGNTRQTGHEGHIAEIKNNPLRLPTLHGVHEFVPQLLGDCKVFDLFNLDGQYKRAVCCFCSDMSVWPGHVRFSSRSVSMLDSRPPKTTRLLVAARQGKTSRTF